MLFFQNSFVHLDGAIRSDMLNDLCDKVPCSEEAEAVVEKTMIWTELEACKRQVFCLVQPHLYSNFDADVLFLFNIIDNYYVKDCFRSIY